MTNKPILLEIGHLRIIQYDDKNVEIQAYESKYNPFEKKDAFNWRFKGYSATVFEALRLIQNKCMLVDYDAIRDIKTAMKEHEKQTELILRKLEEVKRGGINGSQRK